MKYWWFNVGADYPDHIPAGVIALPLRDSVGVSKASWMRIKEVATGDLIFCMEEEELDSVFLVFDPAERGELESTKGRPYQALIVGGEYYDLLRPVDVRGLRDQIEGFFEGEHRPWEREPGRWGDIHPMPGAVGDLLLKLWDMMDPDTDTSRPTEVIVEALQLSDLPRERIHELTSARFGLGVLREKVEALCDRRCCITGLSTPELLQLHHIKYWLYCDNEERVDPHNALLLAPTHRQAFMRGLISFDDDGRCIVSELMDAGDAERLGLHSAILPIRNDRQRGYLAWHRKEIFRS